MDYIELIQYGLMKRYYSIDKYKALYRKHELKILERKPQQQDLYRRCKNGKTK